MDELRELLLVSMGWSRLDSFTRLGSLGMRSADGWNQVACTGFTAVYMPWAIPGSHDMADGWQPPSPTARAQL